MLTNLFTNLHLSDTVIKLSETVNYYQEGKGRYVFRNLSTGEIWVIYCDRMLKLQKDVMLPDHCSLTLYPPNPQISFDKLKLFYVSKKGKQFIHIIISLILKQLGTKQFNRTNFDTVYRRLTWNQTDFKSINEHFFYSHLSLKNFVLKKRCFFF